MGIHKVYTGISAVPKAGRTSDKATLFHKENQPILKGVCFFFFFKLLLVCPIK